MKWNVYVNRLFQQDFRRYVDAYAFNRDWLKKFPNDFVLIKRK